MLESQFLKNNKELDTIILLYVIDINSRTDALVKWNVKLETWLINFD